MHDQYRPPARTDQQRVAEENVHFGHQERGEHLRQIRGTFFQFDHQHLAFAEGDFMLVKKTC